MLLSIEVDTCIILCEIVGAFFICYSSVEERGSFMEVVWVGFIGRV